MFALVKVDRHTPTDNDCECQTYPTSSTILLILCILARTIRQRRISVFYRIQDVVFVETFEVGIARFPAGFAFVALEGRVGAVEGCWGGGLSLGGGCGGGGGEPAHVWGCVCM